MKHCFTAILILTHLSVYPMHKATEKSHAPPVSAAMSDANCDTTTQSEALHQNRLPSCSDILTCLSCCCETIYVLAYLSMKGAGGSPQLAQQREWLNNRREHR
jgi:hypothetical protein